jgi:hypothetical protein
MLTEGGGQGKKVSCMLNHIGVLNLHVVTCVLLVLLGKVRGLSSVFHLDFCTVFWLCKIVVLLLCYVDGRLTSMDDSSDLNLFGPRCIYLVTLLPPSPRPLTPSTPCEAPKP